jgi:hypothetical protein
MANRFTRRLRRQPEEPPGTQKPESVATEEAGAIQFEELTSEPEAPERWVVRPAGLIVILLIVAGLVAAIGGLTAQLPPELVAQWPWLLIGVGALALVIGLVTAWPHGTLGGPALAAIGLAALMQQAGLGAGGMVLAGVLLVALGLGVGLRGLSMLRT